jgi:hypothetical protein
VQGDEHRIGAQRVSQRPQPGPDGSLLEQRPILEA